MFRKNKISASHEIMTPRAQVAGLAFSLSAIFEVTTMTVTITTVTSSKCGLGLSF